MILSMTSTCFSRPAVEDLYDRNAIEEIEP
jgi:hypothetical protein